MKYFHALIVYCCFSISIQIQFQFDKNCNATQAINQAAGILPTPNQLIQQQKQYFSQQLFNQHKQYLHNLNQTQSTQLVSNDQNQNIVVESTELPQMIQQQQMQHPTGSIHKIQKAPSEIIITRESSANKNNEKKSLTENVNKNLSSPIKRRSASQIEVILIEFFQYFRKLNFVEIFRTRETKCQPIMKILLLQ